MKKLLLPLYLFCTLANAAIPAPEPVVEGNTLVWEQIAATTINVHTGSGEYIASIAGNSTQWTPEYSGDYYLVGADHGDWTQWGRSVTLSVDIQSSAVNNLHGLIYGPFSLEIFWEPPTQATTGRYAIYRDDILMQNCNCTSYYEDNVRPSTDYTYTVIPLDDEGAPGEAATVSLRTRSLNQLEYSPVDLRATVYSSTAAELFWTHPEDPDSLLSHYVVYRDDLQGSNTRVAETSGSSFYDSGLSPCTSYVYQLQLRDIYDREALPKPTVRVMTTGCDNIPDVGDDGEPLPPMITRANYESLITQVLGIYTGNSYNKPLLALADDELLDAEIVEQWTSNVPVMHTGFVCDEGSAALDQTLGSGFISGGSFDQLAYSFDNCLDNGILWNGSVDANASDRYGTVVGSEGLSFQTPPALATSFSGDVKLQWELPHIGIEWSWKTWDVDLVTPVGDGQVAVENMTSSFIAKDLTDWPNFSASLEGSFTWRSDVTAGRPITVTITQPFSYSWIKEDQADATSDWPDIWYFESGQLELRAEDGSVLLLDAATGVSDTVLIAVDNDFDSEQFETSWEPWQPLLYLRKQD